MLGGLLTVIGEDGAIVVGADFCRSIAREEVEAVEEEDGSFWTDVPEWESCGCQVREEGRDG